ncbi:hypothetical protein [Pelosinus fermentans]|uniref:Peptidase C39-like domain-containing protein n=1 Tax=Pelosinus fermentans JBW45 TaxID=1192197 RepID=I9NP53_9FIRM|nr:hypothetical protein [Pelosinus fermentans]AJQ28529.1 hypothetical protein JBW_03188 [Pelosinus fermentans JBW45]
MEIKHPEWLQIKTGNLILYGYNQEWYKTSFKKTRGCGPTAAAMLLLYLNRREAGSLPYQSNSISSITQILEDVWNFVTPGWLLGLNSTRKFCRGVEDLAEHYELSWRCHELSLSAFKFKRASLSQVIKFLNEGLASDCPIAFLNLQKGRVTSLESWHWIVLVSLSYKESENRYLATCYDGGRLLTFDLGLWLETTRLGGGFVYVTVETSHKKPK